jgi:hypothetical protein
MPQVRTACMGIWLETPATVEMNNWLVEYCVACVEFFEKQNQLFKPVQFLKKV